MKLSEDVDTAYFNCYAARIVKPEKSVKFGEKVVDDASSSQNAQFRAIQPLPEILRHIDTYVCPPCPIILFS